MNFLQFDAAGHIASARIFREIGFHNYQDIFYQGTVQNLFYPPLQDFLISLFSIFTGGNYILAFKIYMTLNILGLLLAVLIFTYNLKTIKAKIASLISFYIFFNMQKNDLIFQGLGWHDLLHTGLTNQFLSLTFLIFLIIAIHKQKNSIIISLLLTLCILSHLVTGIVACGILLCNYILTLNSKYLKQFGTGIGTSLFFLLPFLYYSKYNVSNQILEELPLIFGLIAILSLYDIKSIKNNNLKTLSISAAVLLLPGLIAISELYQIIVDNLPSTHFTRFNIYAILLLLLYSSYRIDEVKIKSKKIIMPITVLTILLSTLIISYGTYNFPSNDPEHNSINHIKINNILENSHVLTIKADRPLGFDINTYLYARGSNATFAKGLFWESTRNNNILTSYHMTLMDVVSPMLYYIYLIDPSCDQYNCVFENMINDYGLEKIIIQKHKNNKNAIPYANQNRIDCFNKFIDEGTQNKNIELLSIEESKHYTYEIYEIIETNKKKQVNEIRISKKTQIHQINSDEIWGFNDAVANTHSCPNEEHQHLYTRQEPIKVENNNTYTTKNFTKISSGKYKVDIESEAPVIFTINKNYLPGLQIKGTSNPQIFDGSHYIIGKGHNEMTLEYKKPIIFYLGYFISIIFFATLTINLLNTHKRKLKKVIRYGLISITSTLIDLTALIILVNGLKINYILGVTIAYLIGSIVSYSSNKYITFKNKDKHILEQYTKYLLITLTNLLISIIIIITLVEFLNLQYIIAKIITLPITFALNFKGHKKLFNNLKWKIRRKK